MGRGRIRKDHRSHWSNDHRYVLFWAAKRTIRFLSRTGDLRNVELWDLVIQGWLNAMRRCKTRVERQKACTNTVRHMITYAKRLCKATPPLSHDDNDEDGTPHPPDLHDQFAKIDEVDEMLWIYKALPKRFRQTYMEYYVERMSQNDMAAKYGISREGARQRVLKLNEQIERVLGEEER